MDLLAVPVKAMNIKIHSAIHVQTDMVVNAELALKILVRPVQIIPIINYQPVIQPVVLLDNIRMEIGVEIASIIVSLVITEAPVILVTVLSLIKLAPIPVHYVIIPVLPVLMEVPVIKTKIKRQILILKNYLKSKKIKKKIK